MKIRDPRLKTLFDSLSQCSGLIRGHRLLSCNEVLGKYLIYDDWGERYLDGRWPHRMTPWGVVRKLWLYTKNSFGFILRYIFLARLWKKHGKEFVPAESCLFIHPDVVMARVAEDGRLDNDYFDLLEFRLKELGIPYCWLPSFCDIDDIDAYANGFATFGEAGIPALLEWQMLTPLDWVRMIVFVAVYPWAVLWFAWRLNGAIPLAGTVRTLLLQTLDQPAVRNYAYQLYGRNVGRFRQGRINVVSKHEGRTSDRNFYMGLRETGDVHITGAAMYIWPDALIYMHHDENEADAGRMPDKILVNGPAYMQGSRKTRYAVGPSLRNKGLLDMPIRETPGKYVLVVLPYFHKAARELIGLLEGLASLGLPLVVKAHPYTYQSLPDESDLPAGVRYSCDNLCDLLGDASLTVGTMTGCLVESVSVGVPVVSYRPQQEFYLDYLPEEGRGDIWMEAVDGSSLLAATKILLKTTAATRKQYADAYRRSLFTPVTGEAVDSAFGLTGN